MLTINNRHLCELCFAELPQSIKKCPYCSGQRNGEKYLTALTEGTILAGRYVVGHVLGKGGFGITYLCYDYKENRTVAVKEYFPDSLAYRNSGDTDVSAYGGEKEEFFKIGARRFYDEARLMSRFNGNPNIISVYEFFFENNTAYFAMEYLDGIDLKRHLAETGGKISENEALYIMERIADALMIVHSTNFLHRDISPDNIFLCRNQSVKLIDFGAARQVVGEVSKSLSVILKQDFAPLEQYQKRGKQGPWTDIYALGATIYYSLTGKVVDDALSRLDDDTLNSDGISTGFMKILEKMLAVRADDRYQSVFTLKEDLSALEIDSSAPVLAAKTEVKSFCSKCGREIQTGYTLCAECGKKLHDTPKKKWKNKLNDLANQLRNVKKAAKPENKAKTGTGAEHHSAAGKKRILIVCVCFAAALITGLSVYLGNREIVTNEHIGNQEQTIKAGETIDITELLPHNAGEWSVSLLSDNEAAASVPSEKTDTSNIQSAEIMVTGEDIGESNVKIEAVNRPDKRHKTVYKGTIRVTVVMSDAETAEIDAGVTDLQAKLEYAKTELSNAASSTEINQANIEYEKGWLQTSVSELETKISGIKRAADIEEVSQYYTDTVEQDIKALQTAYAKAKQIADAQKAAQNRSSSGNSSSGSSTTSDKTSGGSRTPVNPSNVNPSVESRPAPVEPPADNPSESVSGSDSSGSSFPDDYDPSPIHARD